MRAQRALGKRKKEKKKGRKRSLPRGPLFLSAALKARDKLKIGWDKLRLMIKISYTSNVVSLFHSFHSWRQIFGLTTVYLLEFKKFVGTLSPLKNNQQRYINLHTIFFDLQAAFPRAWRHYICSKLFEIGLRGNLPSLLQSFLYDRSITVRIQNTCSSHHLIQNGVPQGEVWNGHLFLIAINDLINCVTLPLTRRLFADDFSVSRASSNPKRAAHLLQLTLNKISSWSSARGFRFSDKKTVLSIFCKSHTRSPSPLLSNISKISESPFNCSPDSLV